MCLLYSGLILVFVLFLAVMFALFHPEVFALFHAMLFALVSIPVSFEEDKIPLVFVSLGSFSLLENKCMRELNNKQQCNSLQCITNLQKHALQRSKNHNSRYLYCHIVSFHTGAVV